MLAETSRLVNSTSPKSSILKNRELSMAKELMEPRRKQGSELRQGSTRPSSSAFDFRQGQRRSCCPCERVLAVRAPT